MMNYDCIYHKIQLTIEQDIYTNTNESGREAQKETMGLIDIGLPQSKKILLTVTARPGSKVKYNKGKYKLTNYLLRSFSFPIW